LVIPHRIPCQSSLDSHPITYVWVDTLFKGRNISEA
jgi:hypothetical protein